MPLSERHTVEEDGHPSRDRRERAAGFARAGAEQVDAFVGALPVKKIPGVGSVTAEKMHRYGLKTCADIREWELHDLIRRFGKFGVVLHERARGKDERQVQPSRVRKSISVETTFGEDLAGPTVWEPYVDKLFEQLLGRIESANANESIHKAFVKLKFSDFSSTTVERVGTAAVESDYRQLLIEGWQRREMPVRLIGIGVRLQDGWEHASRRLPFEQSED